MIMAALTYNLKKLLKFYRPQAQSLARALQKTTKCVENAFNILFGQNIGPLLQM